MISFVCPGCGSRHLLSPAQAGQPFACPACAAVATVAIVPTADPLGLPPRNQADATLMPLPPPPSPPLERRAPPGYQVLGELGRGGMGVVYKARQVHANREVALKMVLSGAHASAADLGRFQVEAQAVARLQHPGI